MNQILRNDYITKDNIENICFQLLIYMIDYIFKTQDMNDIYLVQDYIKEIILKHPKFHSSIGLADGFKEMEEKHRNNHQLNIERLKDHVLNLIYVLDLPQYLEQLHNNGYIIFKSSYISIVKPNALEYLCNNINKYNIEQEFTNIDVHRATLSQLAIFIDHNFFDFSNLKICKKFFHPYNTLELFKNIWDFTTIKSKRQLFGPHIIFAINPQSTMELFVTVLITFDPPVNEESLYYLKAIQREDVIYAFYRYMKFRGDSETMRIIAKYVNIDELERPIVINIEDLI